MARYSDESQAQVDGFRIEHEPDRHRFVVLHDAAGTDMGADEGAADSARDSPADSPADAAAGGTVGAPTVVGEAHYTLLGEHGIDFDHTVVTPRLRGTGLASLLATRALTSDVVRGRKIQASCWYIEGFLERHPLLTETRD